MLRTAAALALATGLATAPSGHASYAASQTASQTFTPVADAFVSASKPNANYGGTTRLKTDASPVLSTYMQFNVTNLTGAVTKATLQLYSRTTSSVGVDLRAVADSTWGENTVTYANAPAYAATASALSGATQSGTWTSLDVTPLVTGNGPLSLALITPSKVEIDFDSRNTSHSPKLTVQTVSTDVTAPTAPSGLASTSATASTLAVGWTASTDDTGVTGYDVFVNDNKVGSTTTTAYSFGGLACGTTYTLGVQAFDAAGNRSPVSSLPASTTACPTDTQPPTAPTGLAAANVTATSASLSWQASTDDTGVAGYDVFSNGTKVASTTGTSYAFGSLACGTKYALAVDAFDAAGNRSTLASLSATTAVCPDTQPPTAPANLAVSGATQTSLNLSWTASTDNVGVTGYTVYSNGTATSSTTGTTYTLSGLSCGTSYTLAVAAYDAAGNRSTLSSSSGSTAACTVSTAAAPYRFLYNSDSAPATVASYGWNLIDTGSRWSADQTPPGTTGLVWVGDYDNTTCSWEESDATLTSQVSAAVGDPKVWGYFISDEPNPYACPNAPSQHQARSALIHSIDPTKPTVIVLDSNGFSGLFTQDALDQMPLWKGTANYIGLDPYPCRQGSACQFSWIDRTIQAANAAGLNYWGVLQVFNDSSWRWPTADELTHMINQWGASKETGSMAYAWTWAGYNLSDHPDLLSALQAFNTTGAAGPADTTPPSAPTGLSKSAATASSVSLAWTASTDNVGVTGYNVYNGSSLVGSTTSTAYTVGSLACGGSYTFAVEAKDAAGNLSSRTTLTASTGACPPADTTPPSAPGTPAVTAAAATSLALMWSPSIDNVGVTGYDLYSNGSKVGSTSGTTYTFSGLACGTSYTLGVVAYDAAGNRSATSTVGGATSACTTSTGDPVIVAAGDICGSPTSCTPTANLIGSINPTAVLTLGDNAYDTGSASDYASYYDPNWGKYKAITDPAPGNHEYDYGNQQTGYFAYFNNPPAYYSYDLGRWHLISLNGELSSSAGSAQDLWLQNDLAAHKNTCTLAYWHEPRWSSGYHGSASYYGQFWNDLYKGGADVVLNGHDHDYERFAPQDPNGNLDTASGIREFVSGTGGESHYTFNAPIANSEVRDSTSFGVLKLTLHATGYDWKFVPVAGATFTDAGSSSCH